MADKPLPVHMFMRSLSRWVRAIETCHTFDARFELDQLKAISKLLAFDPEFKEIFEQNRGYCTDGDPENVTDCTYALLHAITDAACMGKYRPPKA